LGYVFKADFEGGDHLISMMQPQKQYRTYALEV